jgi:hypothetical protein
MNHDCHRNTGTEQTLWMNRILAFHMVRAELVVNELVKEIRKQGFRSHTRRESEESLVLETLLRDKGTQGSGWWNPGRQGTSPPNSLRLRAILLKDSPVLVSLTMLGDCRHTGESARFATHRFREVITRIYVRLKQPIPSGMFGPDW